MVFPKIWNVVPYATHCILHSVHYFGGPVNEWRCSICMFKWEFILVVGVLANMTIRHVTPPWQVLVNIIGYGRPSVWYLVHCLCAWRWELRKLGREPENWYDLPIPPGADIYMWCHFTCSPSLICDREKLFVAPAIMLLSNDTSTLGPSMKMMEALYGTSMVSGSLKYTNTGIMVVLPVKVKEWVMCKWVCKKR